MVEINFTFVIFTASFLLFLGIMKLAFFDKVKNIIKYREEFITNNLNAAKAAAAKSEQELKESDAANLLTKARIQAQEIISRAIEAANNEKSSVIQHTQINIQSRLNEELEAMIKEREQLIDTLDNRVEEIVKFTLDKFYAEIEGRETAAV